MKCQNPGLEAQLNHRLHYLHQAIQKIAAIEARAAWIGGYGSHGELDGQRQHLLVASDRTLNALQVIGGTVRFYPK